MACPVVFTDRNKGVFVDVERSDKTLGKYVHDVVIAIGPIVEFNAKGVLPFLCLQNMVSVGGVKNEAFKVELTHTAKFRPGLEIHIRVVTDTVVTFEKAHLGIEIGADLVMLAKEFQPTILAVTIPIVKSIDMFYNGNDGL